MAEATILICDGCEKPHTSRKPVIFYRLMEGNDDEQTKVMQGDAHDWNCFGRIISRRRKKERETAVAERAANPSKSNRGRKAKS